jgi:hypothetical protein
MRKKKKKNNYNNSRKASAGVSKDRVETDSTLNPTGFKVTFLFRSQSGKQ